MEVGNIRVTEKTPNYLANALIMVPLYTGESRQGRLNETWIEATAHNADREEQNWLIKAINELKECMQADTWTQAEEICENYIKYARISPYKENRNACL